jgi:hypothetical protein
MMSEFSPAALKPITKAAHRRYPGDGNKLNVSAELRVAAHAYMVLADNGLLSWVSDEAAETGDALAARYREVLDDEDAFTSWKDPQKARTIFEEELNRVVEASEKVRGAPGVAQRISANGRA